MIYFFEAPYEINNRIDESFSLFFNRERSRPATSSSATTCLHRRVWMDGWMDGWMYKHVLCICMHMHVHACMHMHVHMNMPHAYAYACACICMCICICICMSMHVHMNMHVAFAYAHAYACICICICMHIHPSIHPSMITRRCNHVVANELVAGACPFSDLITTI